MADAEHEEINVTILSEPEHPEDVIRDSRDVHVEGVDSWMAAHINKDEIGNPYE